MGAWGAGLYSDDEALDIRSTISLLAKMPLDGDWILSALQQAYQPSTDLDSEGAPVFWMVVADQFEKRGIRCEIAFELGIRAIESGADEKDMAKRGMEVADLRSRRRGLEKLLTRLKNPRVKQRKVPKNPPRCCVAEGDIYSFPAMSSGNDERYQSFNAWFANWEEGRFEPNGWGALVIVRVGREFDWFPWAAYTPLVVPPRVEPTLKSVLGAKTLLSHGIGYAMPRASHFKRQGMKLLGNFPVKPAGARKLEEMAAKDGRAPRQAVLYGWSVIAGAFSLADQSIGQLPVEDVLDVQVTP